MKILKAKNRDRLRELIWSYEWEKGKRALYEGDLLNGADTNFHNVVRVVLFENELSILCEDEEGKFVVHKIQLMKHKHYYDI